jgi:dihydroorotase
MSATSIISVLSPADFHVHLRQGDLSELVTPHVRQGGFRLAYVMVQIPFEDHLYPDLRAFLAKSHTAYHYHGPGAAIQVYPRGNRPGNRVFDDSISLARSYSRRGPQSKICRDCRFVLRTEFQSSPHVAPGVKSYPRGVTTNSDGGIESYEAYYPVFEAMQEVDMVLNLHGEVPSDAAAVRPESSPYRAPCYT